MSFEGRQLGRYRLVRLLGSGGMGDVYLAEDPRIGQHVAIKLVRAEVSSYATRRSDQEANRLFLREARAITKLDHPHILPLFDFGEEVVGDTVIMYLVMPYRQEGSLATWLRQRDGKLLTPQEVAHILQQAAAALQHAHNRQVIHQDVKPSNFLLRSHEDGQKLPDLLLADFGIARLTTATSSASQAIRGTPSYMAPEQWEAEAVPASDQYALAVMAYELLTGRLPFQGGPGKMMYQHMHVQPRPPSTFNPLLSHEVDVVLLQALAKQPEQRFASIMAFAAAFQQAALSEEDREEAISTLLISSADTAIKSAPAGVDAGTGSSVVPTEVRFPGPGAGSDSETYLKPLDTPLTRTPARPLQQNTPPPEPLTPPVIINTKPRPGGYRTFFLTAIVLLVLALVGGASIYALPLLLGKSVSRTPSNVSNTPSPVLAGSALVTITPASSDLNTTYTVRAVTSTPAAGKHQVQARLLSSSTPQQSQVAKATGNGSSPATYARGTITFSNGATYAQTFPTGLVFTDNNNIQVITDAAANLPPSGSADVPAHATVAGSSGNISTGDIDTGSADSHVSMTNLAPFTGGQDTQSYTFVQQSDIDGAANALESANAPNPQQVIQPLVLPNERLIGTPQCKPNVTSNQKAGDRATSVTVTVNFTCTGESYDYNGAGSLATQLLEQQALTDPGNSYRLAGNIKTVVNNATLTDPSQGTVAIQVNVAGRWVYQFSTTQQQQLAQLIASKNKQAALNLLAKEPGVGNATIQLSGGDMASLPADPARISFLIQSVPGI